MNPIVGSPAGLRNLAFYWSAASEVDLTAMDDLLLAGIATSAAVSGAEGASPLAAGVTAPAGSLDGAGRLLASACTVICTYATELEAQQARWAAGSVLLAQAAVGTAAVDERGGPNSPANSAAQITGEQAEDKTARDKQEQLARSEQSAAVDAAEAATTTAVLELSTIAAQLEVLGARTVVAGVMPTASAYAPSIGRVGAGPGPGVMFLPQQLPQGWAPEERQRWFEAMTPAEQAALIAQHPEWVGQADGLPAWARDQANQQLLAQDLERQNTVLAGLGIDPETVRTQEGQEEAAGVLRGIGWTEAEISAAVTTWAVSAQIRQAKEQEPDREVQLVIYEPTAYEGRGRVAISLGDLDSAQFVTVAVPGTTARNDGYLDDHVGTGQNLLSSADAERANSEDESAVLVYMGYRAPDVTDGMVDMGYAMAGAPVLAADLRALRASRAGNEPHLSAIAHSYGGTMLSIALDQGLELDAAVFVGSPGAGTASSVHDYEGIDPSQVFVMTDWSDPVTYAPTGFGLAPLVSPVFAAPGPDLGLGADQSMDSFGAQRISGETSAFFLGAHSAYTTDAATRSTLGLIMTGQSAWVPRIPYRPDWRKPWQFILPQSRSTFHPPRVPWPRPR